MDFEDWLRQSLPALLRYANVLCGHSVAEEGYSVHLDLPTVTTTGQKTSLTLALVNHDS